MVDSETKTQMWCTILNFVHENWRDGTIERKEEINKHKFVMEIYRNFHDPVSSKHFFEAQSEYEMMLLKEDLY